MDELRRRRRRLRVCRHVMRRNAENRPRLAGSVAGGSWDAAQSEDLPPNLRASRHGRSGRLDSRSPRRAGLLDGQSLDI